MAAAFHIFSQPLPQWREIERAIGAERFRQPLQPRIAIALRNDDGALRRGTHRIAAHVVLAVDDAAGAVDDRLHDARIDGVAMRGARAGGTEDALEGLACAPGHAT